MNTPQPPSAKQPPDAAAKGSPAKRRLPTSDRAEAERWAAWVERLYAKYPALIVREQEFLKKHPGDKEATGQLAYYRAALAVSSQIAYYMRTHKLQAPER